MDPKTFSKLRFTGERFSGAEFPVEALEELNSYRDLVLEAAKSLYRKEHGLLRVPPRFDEQFKLVLTGTEQGSTISVLACAALALAPESDYSNYFERARDTVEEIVLASIESRPPPIEISKNLADRFARFGQKLMQAERVILLPPSGTPTGAAPAEYSHELSERISRTMPEAITRESYFVGQIIKADKSNCRVDMKLDGGKGKVFFETSPSMFKEMLNLMRDDALVRASGVLNGQNLKLENIEKLHQTYQMGTPCQITIPDQVGEIGRLSDGWLDGDGLSYKTASLDRARSVFEELCSNIVSTPYIYPTEEGEFRAEWDLPDWSLAAVLNTENDTVRLFASSSDGEDFSKKLYSADHAGLRALQSMLLEYFGDQ